MFASRPCPIPYFHLDDHFTRVWFEYRSVLELLLPKDLWSVTRESWGGQTIHCISRALKSREAQTNTPC